MSNFPVYFRNPGQRERVRELAWRKRMSVNQLILSLLDEALAETESR